MELILLEKVQNLGDLGDKVKVKPGYGRNYLVPTGKAVTATEKHLADFETRRAELEKLALQKLSTAAERCAALQGFEITLTANTGEEGKLYGSIGPREIAEAVTEKGIHLEKSEVIMGDGPIRYTGEHTVLVHLHADVETEIKVFVNPEKTG
jgi:large subunit ribosomal protein L9